MQEQETIILDIDGVMADCCWGFTSMAARRYGGKPVPGGAQQDWDFTSLWSPDQVRDVWARIGRSDDFWETLPVLPSWPEIQALRDLGQSYKLRYVTSRFGRDVEGQTRRWLTKNGFPYVPLAVSYNKALTVAGFDEPIAALIEDAPANIEVFHAMGWKVIVRDQPYNRRVLGDDLTRVSSLGEFCYLLM